MWRNSLDCSIPQANEFYGFVDGAGLRNVLGQDVEGPVDQLCHTRIPHPIVHVGPLAPYRHQVVRPQRREVLRGICGRHRQTLTEIRDIVFASVED